MQLVKDSVGLRMKSSMYVASRTRTRTLRQTPLVTIAIIIVTTEVIMIATVVVIHMEGRQTCGQFLDTLSNAAANV